MDPILKAETSLSLVKTLNGRKADEISRIINVANSIVGRTDEDIAQLIANAKAMNAALPGDISLSEKKQIQRSVIEMNTDPATSLLRAASTIRQ